MSTTKTVTSTKPAAQKPAAKAPTKAAPKGAVSLDRIVALDSASQSGGFYSRGVAYHLSKKNLSAVTHEGVIHYVMQGEKLAKRVSVEMMQAVKASMKSGKAIGGVEFMKAPKGSGLAYAVSRPVEGGKVSQAFFSALFTA